MTTAPVFEYIKNKQKAGHSLLVLVCGHTNDGKSWFSMYLAWYLYRTFNPDVDLFFSVTRFLVHLYVTRNHVLVIDEANKHLDSSKWWDKFNSSFKVAVATQRERNNLYIVCLPMLKHLATAHRDMSDVIIEMVNPGVAKTYIVKKKFGEFRDAETKKVFLGYVKVPPPPDHIVKKYQNRESRDKTNILREAINGVLPPRVCACGSKIQYLQTPCPYCGDRVNINIKKIDKILQQGVMCG